MLSCRADHLVPGASLKDEWLLDVRFAPKAVVLWGASGAHEHVRVGDTLSLQCVVEANPPVSSLAWFKDGLPLRKQDNNLNRTTNHWSVEFPALKNSFQLEISFVFCQV